MDHIDDMDQLREGIGLQAYGQRDPKVEYKMAAYDMFHEMLESIQQDPVRLLFHVRVEQKVDCLLYTSYTVEDGKKGALVSDGILQVTYSEEEKETVDGESEYVEVDKTDYYDLKGKKLFSEMDTADSKMVLEPSEEV